MGDSFSREFSPGAGALRPGCRGTSSPFDAPAIVTGALPHSRKPIMTKSHAASRPPIQLIDTEADRLTMLAISVEDRFPQVSALLLDEISRAHVLPADQVGSDVVTMMSSVAFVDEESGAARSVQLVYPGEADIAAGKVSILTLIGAGLIGLRAGQSIDWPDRSGKSHKLRIDAVRQCEAVV